MPVGEVYRIVVRYTRLNQPPCINQFHYVKLADPAGATDGQIAATIHLHLIAALRPVMFTTSTIERFTLSKVFPLPATAEAVHGVGLAGTRSIASNQINLPSVAAVISRKTGLAGPRNRGRIFIPHIGEADFGASHTIALSLLTPLNTLIVALQADLPTGGGGIPAGTVMSPCLFHKPAGPHVVITSHTVRTYSGTQRRRLGDRWP